MTHAFASCTLRDRPMPVRLSARDLFDRVYTTQRNAGIDTRMRRVLRAEVVVGL